MAIADSLSDEQIDYLLERFDLTEEKKKRRVIAELTVRSSLLIELEKSHEQLRQAILIAVRGIRGEIADATQSASETISKIGSRAEELASVLEK